MKRIPDSLVQEISARSDIVSVVGEYVRLERRGSRLVGLCPFHNERTPSFNVNPDRGFFYCFGCKKGGDAVTFIKEIERCGYVEALERLAEKAGIALRYEGDDDPEADKAAKRKASLYELYDRLAGSFHHLLTGDARGAAALAYARSRGLSDQTIREFKLGFVPADRYWLHRFLSAKAYSADFLAQSGLFSQKYPELCIFAGRLVFPIEDARGRVVAFGGRLLEGDGPKYINSPETALFRKQEQLFAFAKAAKGIRERGYAVVCEGYMDAIAFHASGAPYAVAPLGTAFTEQQAALLKRQAPVVALAFDADEAGRAAAERSIGVAERAGLEARVLTLSEGKDAAELMQKYGPERLKKEAESTITADDYLLANAASIAGRDGDGGIPAAFAYLFPFIAGFSSSLRRDGFLEAAARRFGADPASVRGDYERYLRGAPKGSTPRPAEAPAPAAAFRPSPDAELIAALTAHPEQFERARAELDPSSFEEECLRDAYIVLEERYRNDDLVAASVAARLADPGLRAFVLERAASGAYEADPARFISDGVYRIKERALQKEMRRVVARIRDYDEERDGDELSPNELLYEKMYLDGELTRIKEERHARS